MKKEYAIKVLEALKERSSKIHTLYSFGVNLIDFDEEVTQKMEESIAVLFCNDIEDNYKHILSDVGWWLYENVDKIITLKDGQKVDVNKVDDFVDWLSVHYADSSKPNVVCR